MEKVRQREEVELEETGWDTREQKSKIWSLAFYGSASSKQTMARHYAVFVGDIRAVIGKSDLT